MAITIISQPEEISFSRNPVWFTLKTDNLYSSLGQASAFIWAIVPAAAVDGVAFELKYGQIDQAFTFKNVPDDSGLQIHAIGAMSSAAWIQKVLEDLNNNFLLSRDYLITIDNGSANPRILFTARNNDGIYDLSVVSTAVTLQLVRSGSQKLKQANFKLFLEIWVANSSRTGYDKILGDQFVDVDDDGYASVNLSSHLTKALIGVHNDFDRPDHVSPAIQLNLKSCRQYYIRYGEAYGLPQAIRKVNKTVNKWTLLGGVGKSFIEDYSIDANFLVGGLHRFLKQENIFKNIRLSQPEWLSMVWLSAPGANNVLRVKTYFSDNTSAEMDVFPAAGLVKYDKVTYPVGPTQLNLPGLYPYKIITRYEVFVKDTGSGLAKTEVRTYTMDYRFQLVDRFSVALSSLGAYDTFYCTGKGSTEYDLTSSSSEVSRSVDFRFDDGETFDFDTSLAEKETVLTGYVTRRELKRFRDLFLSWDKFLIHGTVFIPISVNSKSIKEFKDDDRLYALSYEIGYRFSEQLWSEDLSDAAPDIPADLSSFLPIISNPNPTNYDVFYYRKTQTYNRAEIDALIAGQLAREQADHNTQAALIDALMVAMALKSDTTHLHDDRYVKIVDFNDTIIELGEAIKDSNVNITLGQLVIADLPLDIDWENDLVPGEERTYQQKHGVITSVMVQVLIPNPLLPGAFTPALSWSIIPGTNHMIIDNQGQDIYYLISGLGPTIVDPGKSDQEITFPPIPAKVVGDADFIPVVSASSGLPVTLNSNNTAVATISGNTIHIVGAGAATITATQEGDDENNPAPETSQILTVTVPVIAGFTYSFPITF